MTYRRVVEFINKCNDSNHIYKLDNKIEFNKYFKNYIKRDWLATEDMSLKDFENMFLFHDQLICKPLNECEGANIRLINPVDKDLRPTEFQNCYELLKKDKYILEERIYNHPKMNFNNNSINTIRVNTLMDRSDNVHIFKPVLRAGVGDSIVDNYNAGGCEYSIDPDTGIITSLCYQDYVLKGIHHPGCDKVMIGYQIPMWDEVLKVIEEACRLIPECRFIGWDVAITSDGVQLIEGNHNPGNVSIEFFGETGWYKKLKQYL